MRCTLALAVLLLPPAHAQIRQVVSAGDGSFYLVKDDGSVLGWGSDSYAMSLRPPTPRGILPVPSPMPIPGKVRHIAGGRNSAYALLDDGSVLAWGWNDYGQLGTGPGPARGVTQPVPIPTLSRVVQVSSLGYHVLALRDDGAVFAWGEGSSATPQRVSGLPEIQQVAAGLNHSLALARDGRVYAWGRNRDGELGLGSLVPVSSPTLIPSLSGIIAIAAGGAARSTSAALSSSGTVYAWGSNFEGMLGNGVVSEAPDLPGARVTTPTPVNGISGAKAISLGRGHSGALLSNGTLRLWGHDGWGQLGFGTHGGYHYAPVAPKLPAPVSAFFLCGTQSFALAAGKLYAWGTGISGAAAPLARDRKLPTELPLP